jgi:hypothetical protein
MSKGRFTKEYIFDLMVEDMLIENKLYMKRGYKKYTSPIGLIDHELTESKVREILAKRTEGAIKSWSSSLQSLYNSCRRRAFKLESSKRFKFISTLSNGLFEEILKEYGINVIEYRNGEIGTSLEDNGQKLLNMMLEESVLPRLEKECGITKIKINKTATANSYNIFDFSEMEIVSS